MDELKKYFAGRLNKKWSTNDQVHQVDDDAKDGSKVIRWSLFYNSILFLFFGMDGLASNELETP